MDFSRISGLAAIGFAALIVGGNLIMVPYGLPLTGAPQAEVTAFFGTNGGIVGLASALGPATWFLATLFGAGAVSVLWQSERGWALTGFAGLILQNVTFTGVVAARLALTRTAAPPLWALHDGVFTLNGTFLALAMVGLSVGGLRARLIGPWHAGLGLVAAALQFTSASLAYVVMQGSLGFVGLAGWLLWVVWLVLWGVRLLRVRSVEAVTP
ncbi:hypothetical protein [Nonomuraea insulae]|uniref:DUF4386 domain-containing protein n=1 Tax=Nonomuraea insulae TaxID=1616787 RepID=A0ABW1CIN5_9ACTN